MANLPVYRRVYTCKRRQVDGWAWTQAIVAVPAQEVIIICSAYAVPAIERPLAVYRKPPRWRSVE